MTGPYGNQPHRNPPDRPQKRGFLASMSAALAPVPLPEDDSGPLTAPKGVLAAMVLSVVSGLILVVLYGLGLFASDANIKVQRKQYDGRLSDCFAKFGGIGPTAVTEVSPTGLADTCRKMNEMNDADWNAFGVFYIVVSIVFVVMGVALLLSGVFLKRGAIWARRVTIAVTIITVLAAMMLQLTNPLLLGVTVLLMVCVVLCYVSSGATYFMRVKSRRHA